MGFHSHPHCISFGLHAQIGGGGSPVLWPDVKSSEVPSSIAESGHRVWPALAHGNESLQVAWETAWLGISLIFRYSFGFVCKLCWTFAWAIWFVGSRITRCGDELSWGDAMCSAAGQAALRLCRGHGPGRPRASRGSQSQRTLLAYLMNTADSRNTCMRVLHSTQDT